VPGVNKVAGAAATTPLLSSSSSSSSTMTVSQPPSSAVATTPLLLQQQPSSDGDRADLSPPLLLTRRARVKASLVEMLPVIRVFAPLPIVWALLYQPSSTFVFQASSMSLEIGSFKMPADGMASIENVLCVVLIPVLDLWIYPAWARLHAGRAASPLGRMACGMFSITLGFVATGLVQVYIDTHPAGGARPSIMWQLPQYFLIALGEVLVAVPGLEFAYSQGPPNSKNTITALWGITQALGSGIIASVASVPELNNAQSTVFFAYAGAMLVFLVIFKWLIRDFRYTEARVADASGGGVGANSDQSDDVDVVDHGRIQVE
jgi:dipeptide/tripeptide permease